MSYYETNLSLKISLPQGVVAPDNGVPEFNLKLPLTASQLEQIKTALEHGQRLIQTRHNRTKKSRERYTTTIEQNAAKSVLDKIERCKPEQVYCLETFGVELETIIYCLKRAKNSKSKDVQQLIAFLSEYFYFED